MLERWEGRNRSEWMSRLGLAHAEFHRDIGSTNDRGKEWLASGSPGPALILADRQTAGRGRRGRNWFSNHAGGLWFSLTDDGGDAAPLLPLLAGAAVARGVEACLPPDHAGALAVKWPNDVYVGGRKLAGVLCEALGDQVVVGIGLNVNQPAEDLPDAAVEPVSLRVLLGSEVQRGPLLEGVVLAWRTLRDSLDRDGHRRKGHVRLPTEVLEELNRRSAVLGSAVAVRGSARHSNGRLGRIDEPRAEGGLIQPDGALEVRSGAGRLEVIAGTVRLLNAG